MKPLLLLAAQALFAIFGLRQLARNVLPDVLRLAHPQLILDIWAPMAVVGPMLFLVGRVPAGAASPSWLAIDGPLLCGIFAVGLALIRNSASHSFDSDPSARKSTVLVPASAAAAGAGLLMLLLGAAHDLTMWIGQCAFAIGAVLIWINTPEYESARDSNGPHDRRVGLGMAAAVSCAIVQGHVLMSLDGPLAFVSAAMAVMYAILALAFVARIVGPQACARVGLWAAALGVFFALGLVSISRMVPEAIRILSTGYGQSVTKIASGFGTLAPEAAGLIVVAAIALALPRLRGRASLTVGVFVIALAIVAVVMRMLDMRP